MKYRTESEIMFPFYTFDLPLMGKFFVSPLARFKWLFEGLPIGAKGFLI